MLELLDEMVNGNLLYWFQINARDVPLCILQGDKLPRKPDTDACDRKSRMDSYWELPCVKKRTSVLSHMRGLMAY